MEEVFIDRLFDIVAVINALVVCFYTVLWTLGTRDRRRILRILHVVLDALSHEAQKEDENQTEGR